MVEKARAQDEPIAGYRLIERIGGGGFGEVWKAEAPGGILKAVKLVFGKMPTGKSGEEDKASRELKGLNRMRDIRHPFILSMDRFEVVDGRLIIVMELAEQDLTARMQQCRQQGMPGIPRDELLKYMVEASEALDLMGFQYDVQHLDIKPSNLFIIQQHVKVADFGLAKDLEGFFANVTSGMTPMYAAPETFSGKISRRTDQYSLAIVYQQLLTGKLPFTGPSPIQFMTQHLTKEPNLAPLPENERDIVAKALSKEPNDRFATCSEFIHRLLSVSQMSPDTFSFGLGTLSPSSSGIPASMTAHTIPGAIVGIDLGTTNSVVAILEGKDVKVVADQEGNRLTPSIVAYTATGEQIVGSAAKRQAITNPTRTITSVKKLMGRRFSELAVHSRHMPYKLIDKADQPVRIAVGEKELSPSELSGAILRKLKEAAEEYLGTPVTNAVVTVPAYFNDAQRKATKDAGTIAGLNVARIINEPTAAALAYGLDKSKQGRIAVFDLGGGTFDITILRLRDGIFDVLSTNGDTQLGGDDFDRAIVDFATELFKKEYGAAIDPREDPMALQRLVDAAEKAKKELSLQQKTEINLPFLLADTAGPKHLVFELTRTKFEELIGPLVDRCLGPCEQALGDAKLKPEDLAEVVLVGGSTRVPKVREKVKEWFHKDPSRSINPDEAIALGAAIQAAMLTGGIEDVLLLDVTPLSLGVEVKNGLVAKLIDRNTTVPTVKKEIFSTAQDGQTEVGIHVLQGEREFAKDNRSLGIFWLDGIQPAPAGSPQIEVSFSVDANGILQVKAKDLVVGTERVITVESGSGLSEQEVQRMRKEGEERAAEDKNKRDGLEAKADGQAALDAAAQQLKLYGSQFIEADRKSLERAMDQVREAIEAGDTIRISTASWNLQRTAAAVSPVRDGRRQVLSPEALKARLGK